MPRFAAQAHGPICEQSFDLRRELLQHKLVVSRLNLEQQRLQWKFRPVMRMQVEIRRRIHSRLLQETWRDDGIQPVASDECSGGVLTAPGQEFATARRR
jgi:hypothetical protein